QARLVLLALSFLPFTTRPGRSQHSAGSRRNPRVDCSRRRRRLRSPATSPDQIGRLLPPGASASRNPETRKVGYEIHRFDRRHRRSRRSFRVLVSGGVVIHAAVIVLTGIVVLTEAGDLPGALIGAEGVVEHPRQRVDPPDALSPRAAAGQPSSRCRSWAAPSPVRRGGRRRYLRQQRLAFSRIPTAPAR